MFKGWSQFHLYFSVLGICLIGTRLVHILQDYDKNHLVTTPHALANYKEFSLYHCLMLS